MVSSSGCCVKSSSIPPVFSRSKVLRVEASAVSCSVEDSDSISLVAQQVITSTAAFQFRAIFRTLLSSSESSLNRSPSQRILLPAIVQWIFEQSSRCSSTGSIYFEASACCGGHMICTSPSLAVTLNAAASVRGSFASRKRAREERWRSFNARIETAVNLKSGSSAIEHNAVVAFETPIWSRFTTRS
ncbi:hypothetical protein BMS3Bbin04_01107 [bacterium BMS3Bbin04]|nr:hypothetical protein BMS3Bbin04_01107 [bacterium BMS3Bbin04]